MKKYTATFYSKYDISNWIRISELSEESVEDIKEAFRKGAIITHTSSKGGDSTQINLTHFSYIRYELQDNN